VREHLALAATKAKSAYTSPVKDLIALMQGSPSFFRIPAIVCKLHGNCRAPARLEVSYFEIVFGAFITTQPSEQLTSMDDRSSTISVQCCVTLKIS
jgi:hypothetical protein